MEKLGGKVEFRVPGRLVVTIPAPAVDALRKHARVKYLQRSVTGPMAADGTSAAETIMRLRPQGSARPVEGAASPPVWKSGTYKYDGAGNIYAIGAAPEDVDRHLYTYDVLSRLKKESTMNGAGQIVATQEQFDYDGYGNMTSHTEGAMTTSYPVVESSNHLQTGTGLPPYLYNEIGALTRDAHAEYDYDAFGMMRSRTVDGEVVQASDFYIYTASDERIGVRQMGETWTWSPRDFEGKVLRQYQSSSSNTSADWLWVEDYVYRGGVLATGDRVPEEGGRREFHLDHLGSARLVTGADGLSTSTREYAPFGMQRGDPWQETGGGFDREDPMRFTGHERDFRNGFMLTMTAYLDYMHARYYSPVQGRFLSPDPVLSADAMKSPQLWNRYAYVGNNPIVRTDPTGEILMIVGDDIELRRLTRLVNQGLHGYQLSIGKNGVASLVATKAAGPETKEQAALRMALQKVIGDKGTTALSVTSHSGDAMPANFHTGELDRSDLEKFGTQQPLSSAAAFGHELMEQYGRQVLGLEGFSSAHAFAIGYENAFTGWTRGPKDSQGRTNRPGIWYNDFHYRSGDRKVDVRMLFNLDTANIISVTRPDVP